MSVFSPIHTKGSIRSANMDIEHVSGTEGPSFDPYSYDELVVTKEGKKIVLHQGLGEYLKVDGSIVASNEGSVPLFEELVGLSPDQVAKAIERKSSRCKCGSRKTDYQNGHPGEHFLVCEDCGTILETYFHESEII